jgi:glycosyltransferase involved in cell wall biosynthesis
VPFSPKILFQHNVESIIRRRHYELAGRMPAKAYLYWEWLRLFRNERELVRQFDRCVMVSESDQASMARLYGVTNTSTIPTGVDIDYFRPGRASSGGEIDLVFTGSMDWFPNQDAVMFFVRDVLPRIRRQFNSTFWIVGRNPPAAVKRLSSEHADVKVTGSVDDVRPYIDRACVYVVPLRIGGGTRIKIFEAMSMGKAVVSTHVGAEGLPVIDGKTIVLAEDAAAFAERVSSLVMDRELRHRIATAGMTLVRDHYTWDVAARRFSEICQEVVRDSSQSRGSHRTT